MGRGEFGDPQAVAELLSESSLDESVVACDGGGLGSTEAGGLVEPWRGEGPSLALRTGPEGGDGRGDGGLGSGRVDKGLLGLHHEMRAIGIDGHEGHCSVGGVCAIGLVREMC